MITAAPGVMADLQRRLDHLDTTVAEHDLHARQAGRPWYSEQAVREAYARVLAARLALHPWSLAADLAGTDTEAEFCRPHDDIGQPCGGFECDGLQHVCPACDDSYRDLHESMRPY